MPNTDGLTPDSSALSKQSAYEAYEHLSSPIMVCDSDLIVRYVNSVGYKLFESLEADIKADLPNFAARDIVGQKIDAFHKNPSYQHGVVAQMRETHQGKFQIGTTHLAFHASPNFGEDGALDAVVVEWQDRTSELKAKSDLETFLNDACSMALSHEAGTISAFFDADKYPSELAEVAKSVNEMVAGHIHVQKRMVSTIEAFGAGDFDYHLEAFPGEKAFVNKSIEKVRENSRAMNQEIIHASRSISEGDLSIDIDLSKFEGAYHEVMSSFVQTFHELSELVGGMNNQILEISKSAQAVSASSTTLSSASQKTSNAIDEISSSFDETESMVRAASDASTKAHTVASTASDSASEGSETMSNMLKAMESIDHTSRSISSINKVIDEIAFQTNLLALNAAVEAARAGTHGRGFAVVAQEVRTLAQRSAKAARETTSLIDDSMQAISEGVDIANKMDSSFNELSDAFDEVQVLVGEINAATKEQQAAVAHISSAVSEIAGGASTADVESTSLATGAEQLSENANQMRHRLGRFKLRERAQGASFQGMPDLASLPPEMAAEIEKLITHNGPKGYAAE
ncbi:MAG: methyl-accepting chemotaxis protein [Thalassovita sp.]